MKKAICLFLGLALLFTLCACGGTAEKAAGDEIDVDLTALSSTMVYSEVFNMTTSPEDYVGKTVKMSGLLSSFLSQRTGQYYFACLIQDASACCAQGIEFVLANESSYPEDGSYITVQGVFSTYDEDGRTYCRLDQAQLL